MKYFKIKKIDKFFIFGGGDVACNLALYLLKKKISYIVITTRDQLLEKLFFRKVQYKHFLKQNKIDYRVIKNLKDKKILNNISNFVAGISISFRLIFDKNLIELFKKNLFNIHAQNLPEMRGGGGLSWNMMMNRFKSGCTIHLVNRGIDTGEVLLKKEYDFPNKIRPSLKKMKIYNEKLATKNIISFVTNLKKNKKIKVYKNKKSINSSYWPRLNAKKDGWINWSWTSREIVSFIRAFSQPHEGAKTYFGKKIIKLTSAKFAKSNYKFHPFQNGIIYRVNMNKVFVACKEGGIILNKKDFLSSQKLIGKRLITPQRTLEKSIH